MKKLLSLLLATVLLLTAATSLLLLTSCADDKGSDVPGEGSEGNLGGTSGERIPLELPDVNYTTSDGATQFNILEWACGGQSSAGESWIPWEEGDVDTLDGDMLGKAVFNRNAWVEQEYGVEITKEYVSVDVAPTYMDRMRQNASTSDNEFQLLTQRSRNFIDLVQEDYLYDMNNVAGTLLHTDQPWWVQSSVEAYTLGSHLYAACTEMLLRDKGSTAALYFNMAIADDYSDDLPNFFELVDDEEWTFEAMIDACEIVSGSLDGDQEMNSARDMWGLYGGDDPIFFLYAATGRQFAYIDSAGYLEYDFGYNGDTIVVMQELFEDFMYADWYLNTITDTAITEQTEGNIFKDGYALFKGGMVKDSTNNLGDMRDAYGILPYPMYDLDQEDYYSLVWIHHDSVVAIPAHNSDPEMSAVILEALSWESYYRVYPVFYDTILLDRAARDADSKRMLELIFNTRLYDPGQYYDSGSESSGVQNTEGLLRLSGTGEANIANLWGTLEPKVKARVDQINRIVQDLED